MQTSDLTGLLVAVLVLAGATAYGLWRRGRAGRLRPVAAAADRDPAVSSDTLAHDTGQHVDPVLLAGLGVEPGAPVTLLQFSSAFCAPCRATRRVLTEVSGVLDGVRHVEIDAESHLDAVRALDVWKTPTVLVIDHRGRVVQRATGVPAKAQVIAAVAPLLTGVRP
ncbi:thioredoxin family protein [Micromonospora sp. NPDC049679]|uniref:TlpA family protein disulfide reductase n=1 Tax=Micromonospora sp. NPDC049679 TaxID=3155920 RepID=UPI0033C390C2